jgi:diketogulonate reductase-like aldo/keto reductase
MPASLRPQPGVVAIPKAAHENHVRENRDKVDVRLTEREVRLDCAFPPPSKELPLETL